MQYLVVPMDTFVLYDVIKYDMVHYNVKQHNMLCSKYIGMIVSSVNITLKY